MEITEIKEICHKYRIKRTIFYILQIIFMMTTTAMVVVNISSKEPNLILAILCGVSSLCLFTCTFLAFYYNDKLKLKNVLKM